ncbi:MAG: redoxin family protein [Proteobacteria bacterium]|nr:redoxin family protein [Pseudomonadota bacterium]
MFDPENPPELTVSGWANASVPLTLGQLRGRVVLVVAFQVLCPGCIENALPQAKRLRARFNPEQLAVIGLHSVFENHAVMPPAVVDVFVREWKLPFPVAIDEPQGSGLPKTFEAYAMQGTPTMLLFDRAGRLRRHYFGQPDDITLAAEIMAMAIEDKGSPRNEAALIERKIAATLVGDRHDHDHDHGHDHHHHGEGCCHDHQHHDHAHGDACCGSGACGHSHEHHHEDRSQAERMAGAERRTEPPADIAKRS